MGETDVFCAIDLGQSNTRWVVCRNTEQIAQGVTGNGIINIFLHGGRDSFTRSLLDVRNATMNYDFQVVSIAATGIERERSEYPIASSIAREVFPRKRILLNSDIVALHFANFEQSPGITLHAGSGTFAFGTDSSGNSMKVGGWGYLLGDAGGGYWIGLKGFQAAVRSLDGMRKSENLEREFYNYLQIRARKEVKPRVYSELFGSREVSGFCRIIFDLARSGDEICCEIISDGAASLSDMITPIVSKLGMNEPEICLAGRLLEEEEDYRNYIKESITRKFQGKAVCFLRKHSTLDGAKAIGLEALERKEYS
ncbi:N-acetylglucosamine kinase [Mesotoga sp.]|uniref:N-acetylglucosamine kinase n=1 Tax=Mesotoga sp. TaxID=2053577 RepID=UPI001BD32801|nr:BadF/BadG/BcrA/BcrD ATPase family protein [Mesotoga sp.]